MFDKSKLESARYEQVNVVHLEFCIPENHDFNHVNLHDFYRRLH